MSPNYHTPQTKALRHQLTRLSAHRALANKVVLDTYTVWKHEKMSVRRKRVLFKKLQDARKKRTLLEKKIKHVMRQLYYAMPAKSKFMPGVYLRFKNIIYEDEALLRGLRA